MVSPMKIISTLAALSLVALGGALVVTNPSEEKYAQHLSQTITVETQATLCQPKEFSEWLGKVGEFLSDACEELVAGGKKLSDAEIQAMIVDNTDHTNRIVFSTYETKSPFGNYRAIGVLGQFFTHETADAATTDVVQTEPATTDSEVTDN